MAQREQDLIKSWSAKLDAEVLQHKAEIDALSNKIDALSKELAQSQAGLSTQAAERQRLEADVRSLTERLKTSETDVARLRATTMAAAEAPKTELKPETKPEMKPNFGREARPETVAANRPTADTPPPVVVPPPAAVVAPEPPKASVATSVGGAATGNQRAAFEAGFATAKFALQPMPNGELVAGRPGSYYRIVLTNPATGKAFAFGKERYVLADRDADLIAVAAQLQAKLADALPSAMARTLYVRSFAASAALGQSRTVAQERSNLNRISYLPAVGKGGTIKATPVEQVISGPYQAAHLPVLRSANVRELLLKQIKGANIEIIGADLVLEANPLAHTFELILCVVWP